MPPLAAPGQTLAFRAELDNPHDKRAVEVFGQRVTLRVYIDPESR